MKCSRIGLCLLFSFLAACSEKPPVYPDVGLRVYADGKEVGMCGFFMEEIAGGSGNMNIEVAPQSLRFSNPEHEVKVEWKPDLTGKKDHYDLVITADRVTSERRVTFTGEALTILEKPFRVVMDEVPFNKNTK